MSKVVVRRQTKLAVQRRESKVRSYDADAHTVELTAATRTRVMRWDWDIGRYYEELDMTAEAADLSRVARGQCPLLDTHSRWSVDDQLGITDEARFEGDELITKVRFSDKPKAQEAERDVANDILNGVSIGYRVLELTLIEKVGDVPVYRVTKWELLEVSLCPVPADPAAGVRSEQGPHPCVIVETRSMDPENETVAAPAAPQARVEGQPGQDALRTPPAQPAPAAPAARGQDSQTQPDASAARMSAGEAIDFVEDARAFGIDVAQARTWAETMTPENARAQLLRAAADVQRGNSPRPAVGEAGRVQVDAREKMREAIANAIQNRADPENNELNDGGREYRGMTLLEMVRFNLEQNGERVRGLSKRELASLAFGHHPDGARRTHSTSDFPHILANVANRTLRGGYEAAPQTFRRWQRRATAPDFKQITRLQMGGAPSFLHVPEGGQFKMGTVEEGREVYVLATYGRIFAVTRQTLINDDVDAFARIPRMFGRAAADFESDAAYAPIIANPNMGDGVPLFHATHGNLGTGAAITEASVSEGEVGMGEQKGLEGRYLNLSPAFLIVPRSRRVEGAKLLTAVQATQTSGVNVFANSMELVVEARLKASPAPWFMACDPDQCDTVEYCYLEGEEGVYLEERMGFEVDGVEFKARTDFAAKAIDHRGLWKNPGV